jgi:hypothetical protein
MLMAGIFALGLEFKTVNTDYLLETTDVRFTFVQNLAISPQKSDKRDKHLFVNRKNRQKASENFFVFTEAFFISSSARSLCHLANKSRYFQIVNILKYFLLKLVIFPLTNFNKNGIYKSKFKKY